MNKQMNKKLRLLYSFLIISFNSFKAYFTTHVSKRLTLRLLSAFYNFLINRWTNMLQTTTTIKYNVQLASSFYPCLGVPGYFRPPDNSCATSPAIQATRIPDFDRIKSVLSHTALLANKISFHGMDR